MLRVALLICLFLLFPLSMTKAVDVPPKVEYIPGIIDDVLVNPYMGWAMNAFDSSATQPATLAHLNILWRDIEPIKGFYDFEKLEEEAQFERWSKAGVRIVLRVILDTPNSSSHMDIPEWLYEEMSKDGTWYDIRYGKGFSPNYENPLLIHYHQKLINALAKRYGQHPIIAFIQLGSVGHWGEWHTFNDDELTIPFPEREVTDQYIQHYLDAFKSKHLLMRRPFALAADHGMGLFNDAFGDPDSTLDGFLNWVNNGYESWLTDEMMPPMKDFWKYAPSGGEFAYSDTPHAFFNDEEIGATLSMLKLTHMSWIGPYSPTQYPVNGSYQDNLDRILKAIGYRFMIQSESHEEKVNRGGILNLDMQWKNEGTAPFYYPWPVEISLANQDGILVHKTILKEDIRTWLPGNIEVHEPLSIPLHIAPGEYRICVAILDPETQKPGVKLAIDGERADGRYTLGYVSIR